MANTSSVIFHTAYSFSVEERPFDGPSITLQVTVPSSLKTCSLVVPFVGPSVHVQRTVLPLSSFVLCSCVIASSYRLAIAQIGDYQLYSPIHLPTLRGIVACNRAQLTKSVYGDDSVGWQPGPKKITADRLSTVLR